MKRELIKYPNSILRKECKEIQEITEDVKKLGQEMIQTLTESQGLGLAASQIGALKRIIVVQTEKGPEAFINPKIIKKSKETEIGEEGCLSFPGLFLKVKRAKEAEVEAINLGGEKIKIKTEGLLARVFQHEIEHLDGILFIDRIGFWQKIREKLKQFKWR